MKRLLLALALLCSLVGAANASLCVIRNTAADGERTRDLDTFLRELITGGVPYTLVPSTLFDTHVARESLQVGKVNLYGSTWVEMDGFVLTGFRRGQQAALDSVATFVVAPHNKPFLLISDRSNSNALQTTATGCSTMVGTGTSVTNARNARFYDPRSGRISGLRLGTSYVRGTTEANGGMMRRILGRVSVNQVTGEDAVSTPLVAAPDTVFAWARMFADENTGVPWVLNASPANTTVRNITAAPTIFASPNESGQQGTHAITLAALAFMDSCAGGRILRGNTPKKVAGYVEGLSNWVASGVGGIRPLDSTFVHASMDSSAALAVPLGVAMNPCSTGTESKAYLRNWVASNWFYLIPQTTDQDNVSDVKAGTSSTYPFDMFANQRNRQAFDPGDSCKAVGDTSISCLARYAATRLQSQYPSKQIVRVVLGCQQGTWLPVSGSDADLVTRFGGRMGADSLVAAYAAANYTHFVSNGRSDPWWGTSLYVVDGQRITVRPVGQSYAGTTTATPDALPAAGKTMRIATYMTGNGLTMDNSMWAERSRTDGANDPKVQYQSAGGASVYLIYAYDLASGAGGSGMTTSAITRVGFYEWKWLVNGWKVMNDYCWQGNSSTSRNSLVRVVPIDRLGN